MDTPDLLDELVAPGARVFEDLLSSYGLGSEVVRALSEMVFHVGILVLIAGIVVVTGRMLDALRARAGDGSGAKDPFLGAVWGACALVAAALLWSIASNPSADFTGFLGRKDHLLLALFAGAAVSGLRQEVRLWCLTVLSLGFLVQYVGANAVVTVMGTCVVGFWTLHLPGGRAKRRAALVHLLLFSLVYGWSWHVRQSNVFQALHIQGLLFFVFLRHISFVIAECGGSPGRFGNFLFYLSFYPGSIGLMGAPEVYAEFSRRNLGRSNFEYALAARAILRGGILLWVAARIPISPADVMASGSTLELWGSSILLFVRVALVVMGLWAHVDAIATMYGVRLRPNFVHLLSLRDPSELWRSWRGTMTHWLITHIYAPLGADRRHQTRNILAAFAFSGVWHALSAPFLTGSATWLSVAPAVFWAFLNAVAVVGHVHWRRRGWRLLPTATPPLVARGIRILGTELLASFTVVVLSFQGPAAARFPAYLQMLAGFGP